MFRVPSSTACERQGTLFRLPRELRDKIYRYVVKGRYVICRNKWGISDLEYLSQGAEGLSEYDPRREGFNPGVVLSYSGLPHFNSDLRVLCVSTTISDEAMAMLYSESTFRIDRIDISFSEDDVSWLSSKDAIDRMMNIELNIRLWPPHAVRDDALPLDSCSLSLRKREQIWEATLRCISRTMTIRKTLRIKLPLHTTETMPQMMPRHLEMLTRFRTVIVEASPQDPWASIDYISRVRRKSIIENWESMIEAIARHVGHVWGPAIVHRSDQQDPTQPYPRTLTFHPQDHMALISRDRAEVLRTEAEALELEAGMHNMGI